MLASTEGCRLESDPTVAGYIMARTVLGAMLGFAGRSDEAVRVLDGVWDRARAIGLPPLLGLQAASIQAMVLGETGRTDQLRRLLAEVAPAVRDAEERWGNATRPGSRACGPSKGELAHRDGDLAGAARCCGAPPTSPAPSARPAALVAALTALAEVELDGNDRGGGPRRARGGPRRRRQRAGRRRRRPPAGGGRAAGRAGRRSGTRVVAVLWSRS